MAATSNDRDGLRTDPAMSAPLVSIAIPVLRDTVELGGLLAGLVADAAGDSVEVVVVSGVSGSSVGAIRGSGVEGAGGGAG